MKRAVVLVALAACGGSKKPSPPVAEPTPSEPAAYRFDWSPPCRVPVVERAHKKGNDLTLRYVVSVTRLNGSELQVEMVDADALEANGTVLNAPEHAGVRAHLRDMYDAFPALIVDNEGNFVRTESLDEIIAFTVRTSPELASGAQVFESPEIRAQMANKFAEPWIAWVGHWVGWSIAPGEKHTGQLTVPGPGGGEIPYEGTVEHLGVDDGVATLRYTERMEGLALKQFMEPFLRSMLAVTPDPAEAERVFAEMQLVGSREAVYEVETSPDLRTRRSRYDVRVELTVNGEELERDHEWREVEFDWSKAVGCGR